MKRFLILGLLLGLVALPGLASATGIVGFRPTADCDGWCAEVDVFFGSTDRHSVLSYSVTLTDLGNGDVTTQTGAQPMSHIDWTTVTTTFCDDWGALCGSFEVSGTFILEGDGVDDYIETFTEQFVCDCPEYGCTFTPGYWKNHPENWPVLSLTIGGVTMNQAQLLGILQTPVRGDATIILAHHLIAAKLNVLSGSDPGINDAIAEADALLASSPLRSNPNGATRDMMLSVKDTLAAYNEMDCSGMAIDDGKLLPDPTDATWGELKASYR